MGLRKPMWELPKGTFERPTSGKESHTEDTEDTEDCEVFSVSSVASV